MLWWLGVRGYTERTLLEEVLFAGEVLEGGGNVSVREHIVRDTRQQMERGGP